MQSERDCLPLCAQASHWSLVHAGRSWLMGWEFPDMLLSQRLCTSLVFLGDAALFPSLSPLSFLSSWLSL